VTLKQKMAGKLKRDSFREIKKYSAEYYHKMSMTFLATCRLFKKPARLFPSLPAFSEKPAKCEKAGTLN